MITPKIKRKYTRKPKPTDEALKNLEEEMDILDLIKPTPTPTPTPKPIAEPKPIVYTHFYANPHVFIFHNGSDIDTVKYIHDFQTQLEFDSYESQVIFIADKIENPGINNCFITQDEPSHWTKCFGNRKGRAINVVERPDQTPEELYELFKVTESLETEKFQIRNIGYDK